MCRFLLRAVALLLLLSPAVILAQTGDPGGTEANIARDADSALRINASQYGVAYPETFVLMQNRMGLRIEYCLDRSRLSIWISPLAGRSLDYRDRNWSNRDEHTDVFERILVSGVPLADFLGAEYDPFHSILHFKRQTLHIAQVYDQPAVLLWFEKHGIVDIKARGGDQPLRRTEADFAVRHTDRSRAFEFAAALGPGAGRLRQQLELEPERAAYTRADLAPQQVLVLAAALQGEKVADLARRTAETPLATLLDATEKAVARDTAFGRFHLRNRPEMQRLLDRNRRIALSMQDVNGFMRSTSQYIYYLLWYRDGGMNTPHLTMTGWIDPIRQHLPFALANPNVSDEEPKGRFFGQVMGGKLTKWEEDGLFYVVWPAFLHWTQTGDDSFVKGESLQVMEDALDWVERYCFDAGRGLFGRYYFCESPLLGSRDYGWDNATGAPSDAYEARYQEKSITRSYDVYINALNHSVYLMLAAMESGAKAQAYERKAARLARAMRGFFADQPLPAYGELRTGDGVAIEAAPYGLDRTDYQWALSLPPFDVVSPERQRAAREQLLKDLVSSPKGNFICSWAAILRSMDPARHDEAAMMRALDYLVPQSVRAGRYLPMPDTIPEIVDTEDGNPFHDVRPIVFSIAPWLAAVTNFGLHRLPFGIALRGTQLLDSIDRYQYRGSVLDVRFSGEGRLASVTLNGQPLTGTLQVPDEALRPGDNTIVVHLSPQAPAVERLSSSTVQLRSVAGRRYALLAYGQNRLTFENLKHHLTVRDAAGNVVPTRLERADDFTHVSFDGAGRFTVALE